MFNILVLISYDISTLRPEGATRLRKVAKECQDYAQRVQNSVFEANLDYGTFLKLKARLEKIINKDEDSLRFYYLGNNWKNKVEHIGTKKSYNPEGILIL